MDSRPTVSMMASPRVMSPITWPVSTGSPNPMVEDTAIGWTVFRLPLAARVPGAGLGVGFADGLMLGNRPEASPALTTELETLLRSGIGPSGSVVPGTIVPGVAGGEELAEDLVGEAAGTVTATVTAADGGVHVAVVTMLAVAISRTDVASDPAGICACRLTGDVAETEPTAHVGVVPFLLAQPLVNAGFWLEGWAVRATDTSVAGPFSVETVTV
jgi:hypothetical protein